MYNSTDFGDMHCKDTTDLVAAGLSLPQQTVSSRVVLIVVLFMSSCPTVVVCRDVEYFSSDLFFSFHAFLCHDVRETSERWDFNFL